MILMSCLLLLSVLTFLSRTRMSNSSGVVDNVRYILKSSDGNIKNYEFYFTDDTVMKGTLASESEGYVIKLNVRGEYIEGTDGMEGEYIWNPCAYYYKVNGQDKESSSVVTCRDESVTDEEAAGEEFSGRFTDNVIKSMIYGKDPFISIWQAMLVGIIAVTGGAVIVKAEELWHIIYKRPDDDTPAWEDMSGIKKTGIGILVLDAVLLIIFVFVV